MDNKFTQVALEMMQNNCGDILRIEHSLKVWGYCRLLGIAQCLDDKTLEILELSALLHDIGISVAEKKYGRSTSHDQQVEGPPVAREILTKLGYKPDIIERICFIISRHHTYSSIDGADFQLLVEADFLVNSTEDSMTAKQITGFARNYFKSESGLKYLKLLFPTIQL
jgi:hypothetical protein